MRATVAGVIVALAGLGGLAVAWLPQSETSNVDSGTLKVTSAYVRPPAPPNDTAAVYFSVANGTNQAQTLQSIRTDFAARATVHSADMTAASLVVPAHHTRALRPGEGHVMAGELYARLHAGERVHLVLTFSPAGQVSVTATVVGLTDQIPTIAGASA